MKVYIANPLGFSEAGRRFLKEVIKPMLAGMGFKLFDPFEDIEGLSEEEIMKDISEEERLKIGRANEKALLDSDLVLAVLDGPDVGSNSGRDRVCLCKGQEDNRL